MSVLVVADPGSELTQAEYVADFNAVKTVINGKLQNDNIAGDAAISQQKLGATRTAAMSFNGGITVTNAGSTGITVTDGVGIATGGLTVTAGGVDVNGGGLTVTGGIVIDDTGLTVTTGGATITADGLVVTAGGVDVNGGGLTVTGGIVIDDTGLTVTTGGATITAGGLVVTAGGVDVNGGGLAVTGGIVIDDTGLTVTTGGATITAGGLVVTAGGLVVNAGGFTVVGAVTVSNGNVAINNGNITVSTTITAGTGLTVTTGDLNVNSGAVNVKGINGIDINTGATTDVAGDLITYDRSGGASATLSYIPPGGGDPAQFGTNIGLSIANGDLDIGTGNIFMTGNITTTGLVDGVDVAAHASKTTTDHGAPIAFRAAKTIDQTITGAQTVVWETETLDVGADFTANKHTPGEPGIYHYSATLRLFESVGTNSVVARVQLVNGVNGQGSSGDRTIVASGDEIIHLSALVQMNGTTDTMEVKVTKVSGTGTLKVDGLVNVAQFHGFNQMLSV